MDTKRIVEIANANEQLMDGTTEPVMRILAENDLVFACWQDPEAENGVSTMILKGYRRLAEIAAPGGKAQPLRCSAVKVLSHEMAIAARETLGEAQG